jgi:methionyl aminopeptidase
MNSTIKTQHEIDLMRTSGKILASIHVQLRELAKPGVSTLELDQLAEKLIKQAGATPSFKGVKGITPFPASICVAINNQAVHGIPSKNVILQEGQIFTIDLGVCYKGYHTDSANTYGIGQIAPEAERFIEVCRQTLYTGIKMVKPGVRTGDIGNMIEKEINRNGYHVLRDLIGHGIGKTLHEPPQVPNFGKPGQGSVLIPGMTICIEPIIGESTRLIDTLDDNWTIITRDGSLACQQEHTVLVTPTGFEILTLREDETFF